MKLRKLITEEIIEDRYFTNNLEALKKLKELLNSEVLNITFKLDTEDKDQPYFFCIAQNMVTYQIYLREGYKTIVVNISNLPGIAEKNITYSFSFYNNQKGLIQFDQFIAEINDYLEKYKENNIFKSKFKRMSSY